jgi:hypothetical protein
MTSLSVELGLSSSIALTFQQLLLIIREGMVNFLYVNSNGRLLVPISCSLPNFESHTAFLLTFITLPVAKRRVEPSYFVFFFKKIELHST